MNRKYYGLFLLPLVGCEGDSHPAKFLAPPTINLDPTPARPVDPASYPEIHLEINPVRPSRGTVERAEWDQGEIPGAGPDGERLTIGFYEPVKVIDWPPEGPITVQAVSTGGIIKIDRKRVVRGPAQYVDPTGHRQDRPYRNLYEMHRAIVRTLPD